LPRTPAGPETATAIAAVVAVTEGAIWGSAWELPLELSHLVRLQRLPVTAMNTEVAVRAGVLNADVLAATAGKPADGSTVLKIVVARS
jgi:hypothetical protein